MMQVIRIPTMGFASNCWLVWETESRQAAVVDPSADVRFIREALEQKQLTLTWILLTHGHFDHIFSVDALREMYSAPAVIGAADARMLTDSRENASFFFLREHQIYHPADRTAAEGDSLPIGTREIRVIEAPGHSAGSVVYEIGDIWFTGDVLFDGSIGRTDLPGGDPVDMNRTLRRLNSASERILYPGHGTETTLSLQKQINPFLSEF